ncbi:DNA-directed RNA polymerase III subunit RPC4-like [Watersipora subatra]|uniref:DNA-directed RNA polymerase III subunit RPC4-like n=1 Tax=Watersipora subatra TaxID=2589382 RepID=UPI00355B8830
MASNNPGKGSGDASSSGTPENIPRGLLGKGGTPISKTTRLTTVRQPRDLTLGGFHRKVYTPTIPVRPREKPTPGSVEDKLVTKTKKIKKEKTDRPAGGRRKENSTIIQAQSIFEAGPSERTIKRESIYSGGGSSGGGFSRASTSVAVKDVRQTKAETQEILDQLLRDDFVEDDDGGDEDMSTQPVALPLLNPKTYEEVIKTELKLPEDSKVDVSDPSLSATVVDHRDDSLKLVLMQLPDCIPGLLSGDHEGPVKVKQEPSTAGPSNTQVDNSDEKELSEKLSSRCKLTDLSEGKIGKLQILKSGKTRLVLGDVIFDVSRGAPCGFLQELVYVNNEAQNEGHMACLGAVKEKLVIVPNIENLLKT